MIYIKDIPPQPGEYKFTMIKNDNSIVNVTLEIVDERRIFENLIEVTDAFEGKSVEEILEDYGPSMLLVFMIEAIKDDKDLGFGVEGKVSNIANAITFVEMLKE